MSSQIQPCPKTPNCVSTEASDKTHAIAPFRYSGPATAAMQHLREVLQRVPRTKIVSADPTMIRVEFRTSFFGFVDDAVFIVDDTTRTIRFRSASRVGRSDLGVNRKRMDAIRIELAK